MFKKQAAFLLSAAMIVTAAGPVSVWGEEMQSVKAVSVQDESADEASQAESSGENAPDKIEADTAENTEAGSGESQASGDDDSGSVNSGSVESEKEKDGSESVETEEPDSDETESSEEAKETEEQDTEPSVTAELSEDEKTVFVTADGADPDASEVLFPVWSRKDGQDDIEWVVGTKQEDGTWTADITVKKHKGIGTLFIHCYQRVGGELVYLGKAETEISAPTGSLQIEELDEKKGTFTVRLSDLNVPSGISKVQIPVWGAADGQNDIVWYNAAKDGEDYIVDVTAADHQYENGVYHVHCYITDGNGNMSYVNKATAEIAMETGVTAELSEDEKTITVTAKGIAAGASAVVFPVWSDKNGQDDLVWVDAKKAGTTVWTAEIPVKGHKDAGTYMIHCYQTVKKKQTFFGNTTVEVSAPSGTVTASEPDEETGAFTASISDLKVPAGVKKVQFAVWGAADGQNDIVWHTGVKQGDQYISAVAPGEHKFEAGTYYVHCYVTDTNGIMAYAGKTEVQVTLKEGTSAITASDEKTVQIQYIGSNAGKSLRAAVWSQKDGQDDIVWYDLKQNGNGASGKVTVSKHKTAGHYFVHVYTADNKFVGETSFEISSVSGASVSVSSVNGSKGTFKVTVSGLSTPSGIESVKIPVWPNGDQSKIYWYTAKKSGDDYTCTVNVSKHSRAFGNYTVHAYAYANNGVGGFVGNTDTVLNADRYIYSEKTGTYTTRVWILGAGADSVTFRAWSNTSGQDDVVEYTGVKNGTDSYYADIKSSKHKNGGNYTAEVYVTAGGAKSQAGSLSFSMAKAGEAKNQQMYQYAQGFSSDTQYLILVNRGLHRVAIYQGSYNNWKEIKYWPCVVGKPSTPTPTGTFKIKGRFDWFGSDHKCWWATQIEGYYYFHTVLYYWGDAPTRILDGTMDAAASMGCIRLEEPNARWIYTTIPRGTTVHIYN
ncbi:MAG: GBS Bsp-like repeat-containing protein [Lachnospiraceae bacterium]|nr:GBS Bsp-like repeat-containing protein [Lachnospiraceae bacterium]